MTVVELLRDYWPVIAFAGYAVWWASRTNTRINRIEEDVKGIKTSIDSMLNNITQKPVSNTKSPVQLNDYGSDISNTINGKELVKNHLNAIDASTGMNEYQIQEACFNYAQTDFIKKISKQERNVLENVAYKEGIPIQSVLRVVGIELRNAKFKELGMDTASADSLETQE